MDETPTGSRRRDLLLDSLKIEAGTHDLVRSIFEETHGVLDVNSRIYRSVRYFLGRWADVEQTTRAYSVDPAFDRPTTVAEAFDLTVLKRFSQMPILGMMKRLLKEAEERTQDQKLKPLREAIYSRLLQLNSNVRQESNPQAIPIDKLVRIQLRSAVVCLTHLDSNQS